MASITFRGKQAQTVFDLLGEREDSITAAIGWAIANSPALMRVFLARGLGWRHRPREATIRMLEYEPSKGITDLELILPGQLHMILEAKRGWSLPSRAQLLKYSRRLSFRHSDAPAKVIVSLSAASPGHARSRLPPSFPGRIPVTHIAWDRLLSWLGDARKKARARERALLTDLLVYFGRHVMAEKKDTSLVYVVSLRTAKRRGWHITQSEIVTKKRMYFHPRRGSWPKEPPTYIAFRFDGQLQSIHYIQRTSIIDDIREATPLVPHRRFPGGLFLYHLGPPIRPARPVRTGTLYRYARVWCAIDLLLTSRTIAEARDKTKRRFTSKYIELAA